MEAQAAPRRERVDGDVAALGDERDVAGLARRAARRPTAPRARAIATMPLQLGPQTGSSCRRAARDERVLALAPAGDLAEAGAEHDGAAAAERAGLLDDLDGTPAAGIATTHRVDRLGQVGERRHAGPAVDLARSAG